MVVVVNLGVRTMIEKPSRSAHLNLLKY